MSAPIDLAGSWEQDVLAGDLTAVDPRSHLARLRALVTAACAAGQPLEALFQALERSDPIALTDLALGPRAPASPLLVAAASTVVDTLELQLAAGSLYRRLVVLSGGDATDVLGLAAQRHPAAGWLVALADKAGEPQPGLIQLCAAQQQPIFPQVCWDHAAVGHHSALVAVTGLTGRAEPAAALLAHAAVEHAQQAAAVLLEQHPSAQLAPYLAGVWGPDLDAFWRGVIHRLHSRAAVERLATLCSEDPRIQGLMQAVARGLAG
jgi:hypothetical protein